MFVFAGDLHLAPNAWASLPQVGGDAYRSYEQIVDYCCNTPLCHALVLGGDVFDAQPPSDAVEVFLRGLAKLKAKKIDVYAIQGQHGRSRVLPWTSIDPYVTDLDCTVVRFESGVVMAGFDNLPPVELQEKLKALPPDVNILVLHQMCRGTVPEIAGYQNWDLDPEWVPPTVRLVLLGDFHEPWVKVRGSTLFIYSGSICMQSISEPPEKSFLTVNNFEVQRVPLATRPFCMLQILAAEQMEANLKVVAELVPDSLCCVKFDPRIENAEALLRAANPAIHFLLRPLSISMESEVVDITKLENISLEGCLSLAVDRQTDPEFHSFVLALLKAKNPREVIEAAQVKFLGKTEVAV